MFIAEVFFKETNSSLSFRGDTRFEVLSKVFRTVRYDSVDQISILYRDPDTNEIKEDMLLSEK